MFLIIVNIVLVVSAVVGMIAIAHKDKRGFVVFLLVEASMGYIGVKTQNYGLVIAAVIYLIMNIYSYLKWSK